MIGAELGAPTVVAETSVGLGVGLKVHTMQQPSALSGEQTTSPINSSLFIGEMKVQQGSSVVGMPVNVAVGPRVEGLSVVGAIVAGSVVQTVQHPAVQSAGQMISSTISIYCGSGLTQHGYISVAPGAIVLVVGELVGSSVPPVVEEDKQIRQHPSANPGGQMTKSTRC